MKIIRKENTRVKILTVCHASCQLSKDDVFVPIHVGRAAIGKCSKGRTISQDEIDRMQTSALSEEEYQWMLDNMFDDSTGDNILRKSRSLNELTRYYEEVCYASA